MAADDVMTETLRNTALELAEVEAEIEHLTARAHALRNIKTGIESYLALTHTGPDQVAVDEHATTYTVEFKAVPRGREAVRAILSEHTGKPMTVPEIAEEIAARGWIDPNANVLDATRTNVLRAVKAYPNVQRVGHGKYVIQDADGPADAGPSDHLASSEEGGEHHAPVAPD